MGKDSVKHFLITYDIEAGKASVESFGSNYAAALEAYDRAEAAARENDNLDIVLLGAEDLDVVRRTHSSYFDVADRLESLLPAGTLS